MRIVLAALAALLVATPALAKGKKRIEAGGENCATPTTICPGCPSDQFFTYTDTGDTGTATTNDVNSLAGGPCTGGALNPNFTAVAGRDHVYVFSIPAATFTQDLTFTVTPIAPDAAWDPAIYILGTCGNVPSCIAKRDEGGVGVAETIPPGILYLPGPHALYVDSAFAFPAAASAGAYRVDVSGYLPVELFDFTVE
jgi:hypothetical protein